jgi:hypothetical protein
MVRPTWVSGNHKFRVIFESTRDRPGPHGREWVDEMAVELGG